MRLQLFLGSWLAGSLALAVPTLYPQNFNSNLRNATNSNVMFDSQDSTRFYVLPPHSSAAVIQNLHTVTANVGFCSEIADLQRYNADTLAQLNALKLKGSQMQVTLEQKKIDLKAANGKLAEYSALHKSDTSLMRYQELRSVTQRLSQLYDKLKTCGADCAEIQSQISILEDKKFELQNYELPPELQSLAWKIDELETFIFQNGQSLQMLQADLRDLYADFNRMFDAHAQREGGRVSISYDSHWTDNVNRLSLDNPGLRFEKIQTKNAGIKAGAYSKNNLLPGGSVLSFDVGGQSAGSQLLLEAFPESFAGNAVLNLLAVCPLLHPEWFDLPAATSVKQMSYPLTVSYEYPASMNYEVTATYNMYRMYELIKTQGKSSGFFSSKSWSNQEEEQYFKDAFRVDWRIQDDRKLFSEEQKLAINADLRRQIMSRLANDLVMNDSGTKLAAPDDPPTTGALVLSNSLSKFCPISVNCQGASIVLSVMQAIFGSSNSVQNLKRITNVTMSDTYHTEQVVLQPMLTSFH